MSYTVIELINGAYYTSGVVSRDFQTVQGSQVNDGLMFLNDILADKTVENDMLPYYTNYTFNAVQGQERYFVPNLIEIETLVFYINTVRYQMTEIQRRMYFGTSRANNIQSLPYNWHVERCFGGANLFLYFVPNTNYPMEVWGQFRLSEVSINQDLSSQLTTVNLGAPVVTGAGTLGIGQLVVNGIDLAGAYANAQSLATAITNNVANVSASINSNQFTLTSAHNIVIATTGVGVAANTVTFANFSTLNGALNQTYFPMALDRFYINYLKYALAVRICNEFDYKIPDGVRVQLLKYEQMISKRSQQIDLTNEKISTLQSNSTINYAQINLGRGWTI